MYKLPTMVAYYKILKLSKNPHKKRLVPRRPEQSDAPASAKNVNRPKRQEKRLKGKRSLKKKP